MSESSVGKFEPGRGLRLATAISRAVDEGGKPLGAAPVALFWLLSETGDFGVMPHRSLVPDLLGVHLSTAYRAVKTLCTCNLISLEGEGDECRFRITADTAMTKAQKEALEKWLSSPPLQPQAAVDPPPAKPRARRAKAASPNPQAQTARPETAEPTAALAGPPPEKAAAKKKLTDEAKEWFVSSPQNMELYLRFGMAAFGKTAADCEGKLKSQNTDWLMFKPLPRSQEDLYFPITPAWTPTHLMGYYWQGVCDWRSLKGIELSFPQWDRFAGEIKKALGTGTMMQVFLRLYTVVQHFDVIRWRIGKLADDLVLDETTFNHRLVNQHVALIMSRQGPDAQQWLDEQYTRMRANLEPNEE